MKCKVTYCQNYAILGRYCYQHKSTKIRCQDCWKVHDRLDEHTCEELEKILVNNQKEYKQKVKSYKEIVADNLKREKGSATKKEVEREIRQSQIRIGFTFNKKDI